jgi:hypothetical protein
MLAVVGHLINYYKILNKKKLTALFFHLLTILFADLILFHYFSFSINYIKDMKNLCLISRITISIFIVLMISNFSALCLYSQTLNNDSMYVSDLDNSGTTINKDKIELLPLRDIFDIINYLPSVSVIDNEIITNNRQYNIIKMRINQLFIDNHDPAYNTIKINGIDITDKFYGGFGKVDIHKYPVPSVYSLSRTDFKKDPFSVLNRNSLSDEINYELKKADFEKLEVFARYSSPIAGLYGSMDMNSKYKFYSNKIPEFAKDESRKLQSSVDQNLEFGIGLPINLFQKSSVFVSMRRYTKEYDAWIDVKDPIGNNLGIMPDQETAVNNITASFTTKITDDFQLELSSMYGISSWLNSKWKWLYSNNEGILNGINNGVPERVAKQQAVNFINNNISLKLNYKIDLKFDFTLEINKNYQRYEQGKRSAFSSPDFISGYSILKPHDEYHVENGNLVPGIDFIMDEYETLSDIKYSEDGFIRYGISQINPLTGYYEGLMNNSTRNPYGNEWTFPGGGNNTQMEFNTFNEWEINLITNYFLEFFNVKHKISSGINVNFEQYRRFVNLTPYDGNPFVDIHTDEFNLKLIDDFARRYKQVNKPIEPIKAGFGVQDIFEFYKFSLLFGLRLDYFNPNMDFSSFKDYKTTFSDAESKLYFSPRLNIIYNLNNTNNLSFGYGAFYKSNPYIYNYSNIHTYRWSDTIGNSNLDLLRLDYWQLNYKTIYHNDWFVSITTSAHLFSNSVNSIFIPSIPDPYFQYYSEDLNMNSFEYIFSLDKKLNKNWMFQFNYTYSNNQPDNFIWGLLNIFASKNNDSISNYYLTHKINASISLEINNEEGIKIFGFYPLENSSVNLSYNFRSGLPYTLTDKYGYPIDKLNDENYPNIYEINFKIVKKFNLPVGNFGKNKPYIEFSLDIFNLFNFTNELWYDNLERAMDRVPGDFSSTPYFKEGNLQKPDTYSFYNYDAYGKRLYNSAIDFDNNGIITQNEKFQGYLIYTRDLLLQQSNRQTPRTVFLNVKIGF